MKKSEPLSIPGWVFVDNVRANCYACGEYLEPKNLVYWRKEGDRSKIACQGCALEASKS